MKLYTWKCTPICPEGLQTDKLDSPAGVHISNTSDITYVPIIHNNQWDGEFKKRSATKEEILFRDAELKKEKKK